VTHIKQGEMGMKKGRFLFMIDVPRQRVEEIEGIIRKHHPDAAAPNRKSRLFHDLPHARLNGPS
jgi:hypothetical protein